MASSQFLAAVEQVLTCPVCYQLYLHPHVPKDLNCPHTCCQVCLEHMVALHPGNPLRCPMRCKKKTVVPIGGVGQLRTNLHLKNLAEEYPGCEDGVKRVDKVLRCPRHDEEKMHLYCESCNQLVCQNCCILDHQGPGHVIKDYKETSMERKQELHDLLTETKAKQKAYANNIEDLESLLKNIETSVKSEKLKVDGCVKAIVEEVQIHGELLKVELDKIAELKLAKVRLEITELKECTHNLEQAASIAQQSCESPGYAYITQHEALMQQIKKMVTITVNTKGSNPDLCKYQHPAKFIHQTNASMNLGRVVKVIQLKLEQEFGEFHIAYGITCSHDGRTLAAADFEGKLIAIYQNVLPEKTQYVHKFNLQLNPSNQWTPRQVIIHADGSFLVARGTGIEVYSSTTGHYEHTNSVNPEQESSDCKPVAEMWSVAPLGTDGFLAGDVKGCQITVHDGKTIVKTVKTGIKPKHITPVGNSHVAMSDNTQGKVSIVDIQAGKTTLIMDIAKAEGIYYDSDTDCLLVARSEPGKHSHTVIANSGVVEQYCCVTGELIGCVVQGLFAPRGMVWLPDGRLAVADTKTVKIYRFM